MMKEEIYCDGEQEEEEEEQQECGIVKQRRRIWEDSDSEDSS